MFCWRITKYNPSWRNEKRHYLKDDWTSSSDIGSVFSEKTLTLSEYLKIEYTYCQAVLRFMEYFQIQCLTIEALDKYKIKKKPLYYSSNMKFLYNMIKHGSVIERCNITMLIQLTLRENIWCKLTCPNMYVHFGYDYYMYIGTKTFV